MNTDNRVEGQKAKLNGINGNELRLVAELMAAMVSAVVAGEDSFNKLVDTNVKGPLLNEQVKAFNHGVSGGTLYAACMEKGMTLEQFEKLMGAIVGAGCLVKHGQHYQSTAKGREFVRIIAQHGN